jgi:hypothetical protein
MKKIKNSCGGAGCDYKPYFMPMGIKSSQKDLFKKVGTATFVKNRVCKN